MTSHGEYRGRRAFLSGAGAIVLAGCGSAKVQQSTIASSAVTPAPSPADRIAEVERSLGGRIGVYVIDTATGAEIAHRADERFAMCSTFKAPLAAHILAKADRGELSLTQKVKYGAADLLEYAPVAKAHVEAGELTLEALCGASVEVSDNTAANLLLRLVGGPAGFTAFLRSIGDETTRLDRDEPTLNENVAGDPRDTTSPRAMATTMRRILVGDVLSLPSREKLLAWMIASPTGRERLRAGLPKSWRVGDKTGTSGNGAANDVAIAWRDGSGEPLLIASYINAPDATAEARNGAHAAVARILSQHEDTKTTEE